MTFMIDFRKKKNQNTNEQGPILSTLLHGPRRPIGYIEPRSLSKEEFYEGCDAFGNDIEIVNINGKTWYKHLDELGRLIEINDSPHFLSRKIAWSRYPFERPYESKFPLEETRLEIIRKWDDLKIYEPKKIEDTVKVFVPDDDDDL